jgi:hypothetical protein
VDIVVLVGTLGLLLSAAIVAIGVRARRRNDERLHRAAESRPPQPWPKAHSVSKGEAPTVHEERGTAVVALGGRDERHALHQAARGSQGSDARDATERPADSSDVFETQLSIEDAARAVAEREARNEREGAHRRSRELGAAADREARGRVADDAQRPKTAARSTIELTASSHAEDARHGVDDDAATDQEVRRRRVEEARGRSAMAARAAADLSVQDQPEAARRRADEDAAIRVEQDAQQRGFDDTRDGSEGTAPAAAEMNAQTRAAAARRLPVEAAEGAERDRRTRQAEDAERRSEEAVRADAELKTQRHAEEARRRADEQAGAERAREAERREIDAVRHPVTIGEVVEAVGPEASARAVDPGRQAVQERNPTTQPDVRIEGPPAGAHAAEPPTKATSRGTPVEVLPTAGLGTADTLSQGEAPVPAVAPLAPRHPRQYRSLTRAAVPTRAPTPADRERAVSARATPIEVRLEFEKAGFCRVSLMPRRATGMPAEFVVMESSGTPLELKALFDGWYQDVMPPDIGRQLREGIEWVGPIPGGAAVRLSLSGRTLFVFSRHDRLSGVVSAPRLILGEEHVVLCVAELVGEVRAAIALTGSPEPTELSSGSGMPAGWVGLRGVRPQKPVAPSPGGDIMDALRPLPDVEIALIGGIRIARQTWLTGFPPSIEVRGDVSTLVAITIDGHEATRSAEGGFVAPDWDSAGQHTVSCTSCSRTYTVRTGAEDWEPWDAYAWSLGEPTANGTQSRPGICGAFVRPPRRARPDARATVVRASNPILLGARPGEIEVCTPRDDVRTGLCIGFPSFEPVWAIPAHTVHCDKRTARVLLVGPPSGLNRDQLAPLAHRNKVVARRRALALGASAWCAAILAAGRKGLKVEPATSDIAELWQSYKHYAKALRRGWL